MKFALNFGQERGAKSAFLEVGASNIVAQQFYMQLGFYRIGTRKRYYKGKEDAYVMKKQLL
jgi:ribosomal protein S18 acetylase RimI-like enzyme